MGGEDADVAEADGGEMGANDVEGAFEFVAFAAEMGNEDLAKGVAGDVFEELCGGFVGQVPLAAEDALFQRPGAGGAADEIDVVVGLQDEELAAAEAFARDLGGHAEIGGHAHAGRAAGKDEADRVVGVVGEGKGQNGNIADGEGRAGGKEVPAQAFGIADVARGFAVGKEFEAELPAQDAEAAGMVGMLVADADGAELGGVEPGGIHAPEGFAGGDARVDENGRGRAFDVDAVAAAAGSQHADAQPETRVHGDGHEGPMGRRRVPLAHRGRRRRFSGV